LQTQLENKEDINDVVELVQKTVETLSSSMVPSVPTSISPALQSRISTHISYAPCNFVFDVYLTFCRELEKIRERAAKWSKEEKSLPRRLLDAQRVAKELEGVMQNIHEANELFIVGGLHQRDGTAPLISRS
jgi:hypothetical protein